jgi:hypothetical protein
MGHKKDGILFQKGFKRGPNSEISRIACGGHVC